MLFNNLSGKKVLIGLSGGINSMAVLCDLVESGIKPSELHLFYAHFAEHSPDTFQFVADGIRYARRFFNDVSIRITSNSIIKYFKDQNFIPHPANGTCSKYLKIIPITKYCIKNGIEYDLVGYVKNEYKRRTQRKDTIIKKVVSPVQKLFTIKEYTDEWCFSIVDKHIGWHPKIYDILNDEGVRVFKHNNCLPCKNMTPKDFQAVAVHYPENYISALKLSQELKKYWGRGIDDFHTTFSGRELGQLSTCENCTW